MSFGFAGVLEAEDLAPNGLAFFDNWNLTTNDLVEFENEIVCRFDLNKDCKKKLLQFDFSVHEKGMNPPRSYEEFDEDHYYYEFDTLYFFKGSNLKGYYVNHKNMIGFVNNPGDLQLLDRLDVDIKRYIIESAELERAFRKNTEGKGM